MQVHQPGPHGQRDPPLTGERPVAKIPTKKKEAVTASPASDALRAVAVAGLCLQLPLLAVFHRVCKAYRVEGLNLSLNQ
jgi:hypothetical protein